MKCFLLMISLALCGAVSIHSATPANMIDEILSKMTREEKIGQLVMWSGASEDSAGNLVMMQGWKEMVRAGKVGSFLNVYGADLTREVQEIAVKNSRLKIPLLFAYDVLHGYRTIFPMPIAEAASFDPELVERAYRIAAAEAAAAGIHWTFAPMVDLTRDPRWGRVTEGNGEDPHLGAVLAAARVRGFQGTSLSDPSSIATCVKHFWGYGFVEGGRDYNTADISERTLREIVLPPFRAAIEAGSPTVMSSFNEIGGEPVTGSRRHLTDLLRNELGFDGVIVSDWESVGELVPHGVASDKKEATVRAFLAGVDIDMQSGSYSNHLSESLEEGRISETALNDAVRRVLRLKQKMGLFENPYRGDKAAEKGPIPKEYRNVAREVARESMVLLKNDNNVLPFPKDIKQIALIGPMAEDQVNPMGTWIARGDTKDVISLSDGIRNAMPQAKLAVERGCEYEGNDTSRFETAVRVARNSDIVIVAVGEKREMSGENSNRSSIELPGVQEELIRALSRVRKPMVVVVLSGRPNALQGVNDLTDALLIAWYPGIEAGNAIADVLFGDHNPSGKLPITFPRVTGQIPIYYNHKNTGRPVDGSDPNRRHYVDLPHTPLYPFGHGMSYTTFAYSNLRLNSKELEKGDTMEVSVTVRNTGSRAGKDVAQLYIRDVMGSVTRPVRMLRAFQKVHLGAGESKTLRFLIREDDLMMFDSDMRRVVEPGEFQVFLGNSSAATLTASFQYTTPNPEQ